MKGGNERNSGWNHWPARNNDLRLHWSVRVKTGQASLVTVSLQLLQTSSISSTVVLPFFLFFYSFHRFLTSKLCIQLPFFPPQSFAILVCHIDSGWMYGDVGVALMDDVWKRPLVLPVSLHLKHNVQMSLLKRFPDMKIKARLILTTQRVLCAPWSLVRRGRQIPSPNELGRHSIVHTK